jgi:hypothetical protein
MEEYNRNGLRVASVECRNGKYSRNETSLALGKRRIKEDLWQRTGQKKEYEKRSHSWTATGHYSSFVQRSSDLKLHSSALAEGM